MSKSIFVLHQVLFYGGITIAVAAGAKLSPVGLQRLDASVTSPSVWSAESWPNTWPGFLGGLLAAALGLAGRDRALGDTSERARKAVTARLRDSVARITQAHPGLGHHLQASITTGTACAYHPADPVTWQT